MTCTKSYFCMKCGAWKGQLGLEPTFQLYLKHLFDIFREIKRVLKNSGTCWVNLGDTYGGSNMTAGYDKHTQEKTASVLSKISLLLARNTRRRFSKSLLGLPERFLLGMLEQGWLLRNKIIWHKTNHMPTSARDRLACSWDYLFFFAKSKKYYFDLDAIRQPLARASYQRMMSLRRQVRGQRSETPNEEAAAPFLRGRAPDDIAPLDFWSVSTGGQKQPHYATYPERLIERPVVAACPMRVCTQCGKPQLTHKEEGSWASHLHARDTKVEEVPSDEQHASHRDIKEHQGTYTSKIRHKSVLQCDCNAGYRPGIILDPFMGSGTTAVVAKKHLRDFIGFELNPDYVTMARSNLEGVQSGA